MIDYYWYFPHLTKHDGGHEETLEVAIDDYGRLIPATNRFPSAANGQGFKPLSDYVHNKGLKFGIHIMRGIPREAVKRDLPILGTDAHARDVANLQNTCFWSTAMLGVDTTKAAGQAYYDSIVALYAQWGVDYIKADDMSWALNPARETYHAGEIASLRKAIQKSGRRIVLSLSPGPTDLQYAAHVKEHAQLWRISGDLWDNWKQVRTQFDYCRAWSAYIGPEHWPDPDMLPLGRIRILGYSDGERQSRLTHDEQITLMTLWSIFRAPLMMGGDLPSLDPFTLSLLTNDEVLAVNQRSAGNREVFSDGNRVAWTADVPGSRDKYLAVFNLADDASAEVRVDWNEIGLSGKCSVRDLWARKDLGVFASRFGPTLRLHAAGLFRVKPLTIMTITKGLTSRRSRA